MRQGPNLDKRNLWPWRDWMTIGIGVLATEKNPRNIKPTHLVLIADTMGSFGDEYSHPRLHKIFAFPEKELYAVAANQIDLAAGLMSMIAANLSQETRSIGDIMRAVGQSIFMFKMEQFNLTVLPRFAVPPATIAPASTIRPSSLIAAFATMPADISAKIQEEWIKFNVGCDMIIGALDHSGQAALFHFYGDESVVHISSFPGYWAIGSGAENALFWLSHRNHILGMGVKRAAYHAYEAKLMAEGSPHVNQHLDILVAAKGKHWNLSTHRRNRNTDCPVSFPQLRDWYRKYGPKETKPIDKIT